MSLADLTELLQFLHSPNPQARQLSLSNLLPSTVPSSPNRAALFIPKLTNGSSSSAADKNAPSPLRDLKLLCRDQTMIAHDAFGALVNLSDDYTVKKVVGEDKDFLEFLVAYIINPTSVLSSMASMLLSNLTSSPPVASLVTALLIPVLPLKVLPSETQSSDSISIASQTYYLPSSRSASSTPPPNLPRPDEQVEVIGISAIPLLVDAFVQGAAAGAVNEEGKETKGVRKGDVHFLATVFSNLSTLPAARQILMSPFPPAFATLHQQASSSTTLLSSELLKSETLLSKLLIFTEHIDTIRRGGVLSTTKHITLSTQLHPILLAPESAAINLPNVVSAKSASKDAKIPVLGIDILPKILAPLMGPGSEWETDYFEEIDLLPVSLQFLPEEKKRETDSVLRLTCVEVLLLLASGSFRGRQELRDRGVYRVVQLAHKVETDQNIADQISRLVTLLQGEESGDTKVEEIVDDDNDDGDEIVAF